MSEIEDEFLEVPGEPAPRYNGVVKWFSPEKSYGFISVDGMPDVFVHYTGIRGTGYRNLKEGQLVDFEIVIGKKGKQAADTTVLAEKAEG